MPNNSSIIEYVRSEIEDILYQTDEVITQLNKEIDNPKIANAIKNLKDSHQRQRSLLKFIGRYSPHYIDESTSSVVQFWADTFGRNDSNVGESRYELVQNALLAGYSLQDLYNAISGCSQSDWHVENNQYWLTIILRDCDQIEKFISIYDKNKES